MIGLLVLQLVLQLVGDQAPAVRPAVQPAGRAAWELLLVIMGAIATTTAGLTVLWKIVRPHVDRYVRNLIRPIAEGVADVRSEVKPDSGHSLKDTADKTDGKLDQLADSISRIHRRIDSVDGRQRMTQATLDQHVTESRAYLATAVEQLREQGVQLPGPSRQLGIEDEEVGP